MALNWFETFHLRYILYCTAYVVPFIFRSGNSIVIGCSYYHFNHKYLAFRKEERMFNILLNSYTVQCPVQCPIQLH
uniref:Uncharacterized protein n=1 Tax=Anguilla anguilla TaxID=7936 RepID=A0A0E9X4Q1_ANGAN